MATASSGSLRAAPSGTRLRPSSPRSRGGGNNPKVVVEDSGGGIVSGYVGGTIDTTSVFGTSSANPVTPSGPNIDGNDIPSLDDLIPPSMIEQIIDLSKQLGRYYDNTKGDAIPSDKSGICVIRVADGTSVSLGNNGGINTLADPGILLILGPEGGSGNGITLDMGATRRSTASCTRTGASTARTARRTSTAWSCARATWT
jgi:hypothetical protein